MADSKINITVLLKHFDTNNLQVYKAFEDQETERKELDRMLGYILPLWLSGIETGLEQLEGVFKFNQYVNVGWSELKDHPELQAKVLALIGPGKTVRHQFYKRGAGVSASNLTTLLQRRYPDIRTEEIILWCSVNSEAALRDLCDDYGVQLKDRDVIISEYRDKVR